jgi:C_GCAxxG_C_C family probable redox protein
MEKIELAAKYHELGFGCSQSVLTAFAQDFGLSEQLALKLATGFGSGMGRMCEVCGALTGAFMVIGLKHGRFESDGTRYGNETETTYRLVREAAQKFKEKNGSIFCRDLIGHDLNDPVQRAEVVEMGLFKTTCSKCIRDAVEILGEIL